jgi:hypothetical protein
MLNRTLYVIGNGFDLAHGLPTSYAQFHKFLEAVLKIADHRQLICTNGLMYMMLPGCVSILPA